MKCHETGKQCYLTAAGAHEALRKIERSRSHSAAAVTTNWHKGKATAYRCTFCNAWHVGHAAKPGERRAG